MKLIKVKADLDGVLGMMTLVELQMPAIENFILKLVKVKADLAGVLSMMTFVDLQMPAIENLTLKLMIGINFDGQTPCNRSPTMML